MNENQHTVPCADCPFRRTTQPGCLGRSSTPVYVGQANGPFWLPCHSAYVKGVDAKEQDPKKIAQCVGAAHYRANCVPNRDRFPDFLLKREQNTEIVFASAAEFVAHHDQIPLEFAEFMLRSMTPDMCTEREITKQEARFYDPGTGERIA